MLPVGDCLLDDPEIFRKARGREFFHELRRAAEFDLEHYRQVAIRAQTFEMEFRNTAKLFLWIFDLGDLALPFGDELRHCPVEYRMQDVVFALEIEIDRAVRN